MENKYVEFAKLVALFLAVVLPVPVIGYIIHTPASITISYLSFVIIGLVFPFFWYMAQKKGFGQEYRAYRSVAHVVLWIACLPLLTAVLWYYLPQMELSWRHVGYWLVIPAVLLMTVYLAIITALDHYAVSVYARLMEAHREFLRIWMACTFLIGSIPGMAILSFFGLYALGGGGIDPVSGAYILMSLMWYVLYIKIFIAMLVIGVYLFFALNGSKPYRATQVIFTASIWLILMFIPFVISIRMPWEGNWRAYLDPAYFSMFPFISDMWVLALALWSGQKITQWIFSAKDGDKAISGQDKK